MKGGCCIVKYESDVLKPSVSVLHSVSTEYALKLRKKEAHEATSWTKYHIRIKNVSW